jgi:diacylglycerol O-acyltransferase / wax synthase
MTTTEQGGAVERLHGLDTAFLYLETPTTHLHVAWAATLDTSHQADAATAPAMAALIANRLPRLPILRRKLASTHLGLTQPDWIDVVVRPDDHITVHRSDDLEAVAGEVLSQPLDRRRPLWELHIVEGLARQRVGLLIKAHHALLDGPSGAELMVQLLDLEPHPRPTAVPAPIAADEPPGLSARARVVGRRLRHAPGRAQKSLADAADVLRAAWQWDDAHGRATVPVLPGGAPRTLFNRPITARRAVRFTGVSLDEIDEIRRRSNATVNDVVLAATAGALRRYLHDHGALPAQSLHALVPTSLRTAARSSGGNQISGFLTTLATDIADSATRLTEISRVTDAAKRRHDETRMAALVELTELVPPGVGQAFTRWMSRVGLPRWGPVPFNLVVSNVPGPDVPFYCNGALVERAYPMGPITDWSAINVTVVSYRRHLTFGLTVCPDVVPDLDHLVHGLELELKTLRATAAA